MVDIVATILRENADKKNPMVDIVATILRENAARIQLESLLIPLDSDGNRLLLHCLHESMLVVLCDIPVAVDRAYWEAAIFAKFCVYHSIARRSLHGLSHLVWISAFCAEMVVF